MIGVMGASGKTGGRISEWLLEHGEIRLHEQGDCQTRDDHDEGAPT